MSSKVEEGTPVDLDACLEKFFADEEIPDFFCATCKAKTVCVKRQRFVSYPKNLVIVL